MSDLIIPDRRFEMPSLFYPDRAQLGNLKIDWTKSITEGLMFYPVFDGGIHDLVSGQNGVINGTGISVENGKISTTGSSSVSFANVEHGIGTGPYTFFAYYEWDGSAGDWQTVLSLPNNSELGMYCPKRSSETVLSQDSTLSNAATWSSASISANELNLICISSTGSGAIPVAHVNGVSKGGANAGVSYASGTTGINLFTGQGGEYGKGTLKRCAVWNRALSDVEKISLYDNIHQFVEPV